MYVYKNKNWPNWKWDEELINKLLMDVVSKQSILLGKMSVLGFDVQEKTALETGVLDVLNNSRIEGEKLEEDHVRSSIAKNLGLSSVKEPKQKQEHTEGAINMFLNATRYYNKPISGKRMFDWHAGLFPTGRSAGVKIEVARWRTSPDAMQIVSGPMGKEVVHYQAPSANEVPDMMKELIEYCNKSQDHTFIKAGVAHLWFEILHPFDDGNGRIGRALVDKILCEADSSEFRYYSFSKMVLDKKKEYYKELNNASKGDLEITSWLKWFLNVILQAVEDSEIVIRRVDFKRRFWGKYAGDKFNDRQLKVIKKLLDGFDGNITSSRWTRMTKCTKMTATRDINNLLEKKVLKKNDAGGRSTAYSLRIF